MTRGRSQISSVKNQHVFCNVRSNLIRSMSQGGKILTMTNTKCTHRLKGSVRLISVVIVKAKSSVFCPEFAMTYFYTVCSATNQEERPFVDLKIIHKNEDELRPVKGSYNFLISFELKAKHLSASSIMSTFEKLYKTMRGKLFVYYATFGVAYQSFHYVWLKFERVNEMPVWSSFPFKIYSMVS